MLLLKEMDQCLNQLQQSSEIVTIHWEKQSVQLTGSDLQRLVLINSPTNPGESWLNDKVFHTLLRILICVTRNTYAHTQLLNSYILLLALDQRAKDILLQLCVHVITHHCSFYTMIPYQFKKTEVLPLTSFFLSQLQSNGLSRTVTNYI